MREHGELVLVLVKVEVQVELEDVEDLVVEMVEHCEEVGHVAVERVQKVVHVELAIQKVVHDLVEGRHWLYPPSTETRECQHAFW